MRHSIAVTGLFCLFASCGLAAQPPVTDDTVVRMSPFEVSANSVEFRSWIKISSPHYLLYTDTRESEAMNALRELEDVWMAGQVYFRRPAQNLPPMIVVLPTSGSDWRKIESKGNVDWKVAVSDPGGLFRDLVLVQYDWQNEGLWIVRSPQGRSIARGLNLHGPFWFMRGIGKFFETVEFNGEVVQLGRQNRRMFALARDGWLAWPRFFRMTEDSPDFTKDGAMVHQIEGQCALFVHYMLANPEPRWVGRLLDWAARMDAGREPTDDEFCEVFGHDLATWQRKMERYLDGGAYQMRTLPLPKAARAFPTAKLDLPVREMRELFVLCQILNQTVPASHEALASLLARDIKTESLRELLVEACFKRGRPEDGFGQLRRIAASSSLNPAVSTALAAEVALKQLPATATQAHTGADDSYETRRVVVSIDSRLSMDAAREIRAYCEKALEIEPRFAEAINLRAWCEALGPAVDNSNVAVIEELYGRISGYASTSDCVAAMAVAAWRKGDHAWARRIAETLDDSPYSDEDARRIAAQLLKAIAPATTSNGAPGAR